MIRITTSRIKNTPNVGCMDSGLSFDASSEVFAFPLRVGVKAQCQGGREAHLLFVRFGCWIPGTLFHAFRCS